MMPPEAVSRRAVRPEMESMISCSVPGPFVATRGVYQRTVQVFPRPTISAPDYSE